MEHLMMLIELDLVQFFILNNYHTKLYVQFAHAKPI